MSDKDIKDKLKKEIDDSSDKIVKNLSNGDKFIHDSKQGYTIDIISNDIKKWYVKPKNVPGERFWIEAEFKDDEIYQKLNVPIIFY